MKTSTGDGIAEWHSLERMSAEPTIDQSLRSAIENTRIVKLRYGNRERIIEPHDYGIQKGVARLLAYQIGGASSWANSPTGDGWMSTRSPIYKYSAAPFQVDGQVLPANIISGTNSISE